MAGLMSFDSPSPQLEMKFLGYGGIAYIPIQIAAIVAICFIKTWLAFLLFLVAFLPIIAGLAIAYFKSKS